MSEIIICFKSRKNKYVFSHQLNFLGHEAAGVVTAVGRDVKSLSVGSRIAIENHFFCETCYTCRVSKTQIMFKWL